MHVRGRESWPALQPTFGLSPTKMLPTSELEHQAVAEMQAVLQAGKTPIAWIDIGVYF